MIEEAKFPTSVLFASFILSLNGNSIFIIFYLFILFICIRI